MKVTLDKNEIQEAVQHYISNVLGSSLLVAEIAVIQGRESNGARIEIDLFKAEPIDLDNGEIISRPIPVEEEPIFIPEPVKATQESQPKAEKTVDKPVAKKSTSVAALNLPVDDSEEDEEITPMDPEPETVKEDHVIPSEPKSASVASTATTGMKPLPGSFFGSN